MSFEFFTLGKTLKVAVYDFEPDLNPAPLIQAIGEAERIEICINSNGGSCFPARAIAAALADKHATGHIIKCMSAGWFVALACRELTMQADGRAMLHGVHAGAYGMKADLERALSDIKQLDHELFRALRLRTRQPGRIVNGWLRKDFWLTAQECLRLRLIDSIIPTPSAPAIPRAAASEAQAAAEDPKVGMILDFLKCIGPIQPADRAAFLKDLSFWVFNSVGQG
jgi:ATP-dependent protease ClpP protease subunit